MKTYRNPSRSDSYKNSATISRANGKGYAKRLARKKAKAEVSSADIYELIQEKTKRSNVRLDLGHDEVREVDVVYDEPTEDQNEVKRARLIGENVDDEEIPSEDDEEIDSDGAFEESDEERFAGFFSLKVCRNSFCSGLFSDKVIKAPEYEAKETSNTICGS